MIRQATTRVITQTAEDFAGVPTLVIFRQAPFRFTLTAPASVQTPFSVYINNDYTQKGAKDLIEFIKNLAITEIEQWSETELLNASQAKTLYIVYESFSNIKLDFSKEILTKEKLQEDNPECDIWVTYDATDPGLIALVDELLNWL